jgi:hypothetical protein
MGFHAVTRSCGDAKARGRTSFNFFEFASSRAGPDWCTSMKGAFREKSSVKQKFSQTMESIQ